MNLIRCSNQSVLTHITAKAFLLDSPRGVYTSMRTFHHASAVFDLHIHLNRLRTSLAAFREGHSASLVDETVLSSLRDSISDYKQATSAEDPYELRLTVLVVPTAADGVDVRIHISALPPIQTEPVTVDLVQCSRKQFGRVKDSEWVRLRENLEHAQVNEVLLMEEDGRILEGLSSNFFVSRGNCLYTSPDEDILPGTVRAEVMEFCKEKAIPLLLETPHVSQLSTAEGCFITSTSRPLYAVKEIRFVGDAARQVAKEPTNCIRFRTDEITKAIQKEIISRMQRHSTPLFE